MVDIMLPTKSEHICLLMKNICETTNISKSKLPEGVEIFLISLAPSCRGEPISTITTVPVKSVKSRNVIIQVNLNLKEVHH